jgi:hypothetical protein
MNCCAWCLPVVMVIPPMQSISKNNDGTYTLYMVPPHGRYARFAMPAMFGALAAEVWWLLINSQDFGCIWSVTVTSLVILHLLIPGFLCFTWVWTGLGPLISTWSICWKGWEHPWLLSTTKLLINSFGRLKRGLLYGTDFIPFKSIFHYWHSCVSRKYSIWLNIHEFIYFDWLVFRQKFGLIPFSFPLEPQVHALLYYVGFAIYIQIIAEWLWSYS